MYQITDLNTKMFSLDGIAHLRKFFSNVKGDRVRIYNAYDASNVLLDYTHYSEIELNGITYFSAAALQEALLTIIFLIGSENGTLPDGLLFIGDWSNVDGEVTIPSGALWRINGVTTGNTTEWEGTINPATAGNYRIDIIFGNSVGGIGIKEGLEDETTAFPPNLDPNTVELFRVNIFGAVISSEDPITGNLYVTKKSLGTVNVNTTDNDVILYFTGGAGENTFNVEATGNGVIKCMSTLIFVGTEGFYQGKIVNLKNSTGSNLTVKNNTTSSAAHRPFIMPNSLDLVIPDGSLISFRYSGSELNYLGLDYKPSDAELVFVKTFPAAFAVDTSGTWRTLGASAPFFSTALNATSFGSGTLPTIVTGDRPRAAIVKPVGKLLKKVVMYLDYPNQHQFDLCVIKMDSYNNSASNPRSVLNTYVDINASAPTPSGAWSYSKSRHEFLTSDISDTNGGALTSFYFLFIKGYFTNGGINFYLTFHFS